jgi:tyrosine-protein phosphatase YwqE
LVHLVASDAHRPTGRAPILSKAYETISSWLGKDAADLMMINNPHNIISGVELDSLPVTTEPGLAKKRKSLFRFMKQKVW